MPDIDQGNFLVYRSSAGSGKTYTLVKEYLKIILKEPVKFRQILAITFTNKAAKEMKDRVLEKLLSISESSPENDNSNTNELLNKISDEIKVSKAEIIRNASYALSLILHNYADFAITTIDSFVHRVIRSFAIELDLSMNFEVEMDTDELTAKCVGLLLDEAGNNKDLTRILINFIKYKASEDLNLNIERDLISFAKNLGKEVLQKYLSDFRKLKPDDFEKIFRKNLEFIEQYETDIFNIASEASNLIREKGIAVESFYYGAKGIANYFTKLAEKDFKNIEGNSYVKKTIAEDRWISVKTSEEDRLKILEIKDQLTEYYYRITKRYSSDHPDYITYKLLNQNIYQLAVLNLIEGIMDKFKKENNLLLINEFNKIVSEVVFNEPVPFIYERLGEKFKHFFIDEFQDTSVLQWLNLLPLVDNSLAEGNFNMVVGDGKQAIYRWRNGEVEQFIKLPKLLDAFKSPFDEEREETLRRNCREKDLEKNYRSRKNIVEFNNEFFQYIHDNILPEEWQDVYKNLKQKADEKRPGGYVQIDFLINDKGSEISFDDSTNERILEIIKKRIELGYRARDIAVLCRDKKTISKIANYLTKNDIKVVSSESLLLSTSPVVNFFISFMKLMSHPEDNIYYEEVKQFVTRNESGATEEMTGKETGADTKNLFFSKINLSYLGKFTVYDICEHLVNTFRLNREVDPYLNYFLDIVFEYSLKHNPGILDFLDWWEDKKADSYVIIPEETDAVKIMTIHKAKGLEFPVVIYPYANQKVKAYGDYLWVPNQDDKMSQLPFLMFKLNKLIAETDYSEFYSDEKNKLLLDLINLLYVVMTRAEESLYIISEKPLNKSNSETIRVHDIIHDFLKNQFDFGDDELDFSFGKEMENTALASDTVNRTLKLDKVISTDWRKHAIVSRRAPEIWNMDDPELNQKWGNLVHSVLSKIKYADDKDIVLDKYYNQGYLNEQERDGLAEKINEIINMPELRSSFSREMEVKAEAEILLPDSRSYRPDRVVINKESALLIDYKTGKPSEYHKTQLMNYASLLEAMGYKVEKKYLVYIDDVVDAVEV